MVSWLGADSPSTRQLDALAAKLAVIQQQQAATSGFFVSSEVFVTIVIGISLVAIIVYQQRQLMAQRAADQCQPCDPDGFPATPQRPGSPTWMQSAPSSASAGMGGRNNSGDLREKLKGLTTKQVLLASRGPTMEEAIEMNAERQRELAEVQPREVLRQLQEGNSRFWMGLAQRPEMSAMERRALIMQQSPRVAILGCSDSRVPIEIVFDQGLGECFAVRVAGNVYSAATAASLDYAVAHLKVKLVVVMGHEGCGAVKAAQLPDEKIDGETPALKHVLHSMKRELCSSRRIMQIRDKRARDREAVITNVAAQMRNLLEKSPHIQEQIEAGTLLVVGAFYEITSGMVDFFEPEHVIPNLESTPLAFAKKTPPPPARHEFANGDSGDGGGSAGAGAPLHYNEPLKLEAFGGDGAAEGYPSPKSPKPILGMESPSKRWDATATSGVQQPPKMSLGR